MPPRPVVLNGIRATMEFERPPIVNGERFFHKARYTVMTLNQIMCFVPMPLLLVIIGDVVVIILQAIALVFMLAYTIVALRLSKYDLDSTFDKPMVELPYILIEIGLILGIFIKTAAFSLYRFCLTRHSSAYNNTISIVPIRVPVQARCTFSIIVLVITGVHLGLLVFWLGSLLYAVHHTPFKSAQQTMNIPSHRLMRYSRVDLAEEGRTTMNQIDPCIPNTPVGPPEPAHVTSPENPPIYDPISPPTYHRTPSSIISTGSPPSYRP